MKQSNKVEFNTFVKGLITEASPLNFPADASREEQNFELNTDGTRRRRLGFDFEDAHVKRSTTQTVEQFNRAPPLTYRWSEVAGKPGQNFIAVQANNSIYFFDMDAEVLSDAGYKGMITLEGYPLGVRYSLTSIDGFLIVAAGVDTIAVISFNDPTFSVSFERLAIRDLWGVEV